jgi:Holliday junction resolvase-like predicted endonuclease
MPKIFTSVSQKLGKQAEDAVAQYLERSGFTIVEQNYTLKCGEIDIIAVDVSRVTHFVEVKAVSRVTFEGGVEPRAGEFRPEDNMSFRKVQKLKTTIQTYLMSVKNDDKRQDKGHKRHVENEFKWQTDLFVVHVQKSDRKMIIKPIWNIVL